jgi:uncharacterized protein (TIGR02147 family)
MDAREELLKILNQLFQMRQRSNPAFSKRAFAKHLEISPSYLREIEIGKKLLTPKKALEIASRLGLSVKESRRLEILARLTQSSLRSQDEKLLLQELEGTFSLPDPPMVDPGANGQALDWKVKAFASLLEIHKGEYDPNIFSQELGIEKSECDQILQLLLKLRLVAHLKSGKGKQLYTPQKNPAVWAKTPNQDIQRYNEAVLDLARKAIQTQDQFQRIAVNATVSFSALQLEEAWRLINECALKLIKLSDAIPEKDVVYQASLHFFQLTRPSNGGKSLRHGRKGPKNA